MVGKQKMSAYLIEELVPLSPRFEHHCYKTCPEKTFSEEWECKPCNINCGNCDRNECYWCEEGFFLSGEPETDSLPRRKNEALQSYPRPSVPVIGFRVFVPASLVQRGILIWFKNKHYPELLPSAFCTEA